MPDKVRVEPPSNPPRRSQCQRPSLHVLGRGSLRIYLAVLDVTRTLFGTTFMPLDNAPPQTQCVMAQPVVAGLKASSRAVATFLAIPNSLISREMTKPPPAMRNVVVPLVWSRRTVASDVADCLTFKASS